MDWRSLSLLLLCVGCVVADLHEWKVVRAKIEKKEDLVEIASWDLDVWSYESNLIIGDNDMRVNAEHVKKLHAMGVQHSVLVEDVQVMLEELSKEAVNETAASWFDSYHTYAEFNTYLTNLTNVYPTLVKKSTIGQSIQGNNIDVYVITGTSTATKKKVVFTGMQHAREWISPHTVVYILTNLVTLYNTDTSVKALMDGLVFHIIPIMNPDGYIYTWGATSQRLWRKNRRANTGGSYGVDLNRNWDDGHWGGDGSSGTPSSDTYRGTAAFSEPETKAVSTYITNNRPFGGYIDFHSYSQLVLRNYGWTNQAPPDSAVQKLVGDQMSAQIRAQSGKVYTSEPSYQLYYTTGTSDDWAYVKAGIKLTYCIELRDTGTYGFQLPANQIIPTGQEIWAAMKYYFDYIIKNA